MKILHIYPDTCEYAYPEFPEDKLNTDSFDEQIIAQTDLEVRYLSGLTLLGVECVFFYPRKYKLSVKEFQHKGGYRIIRFPISFSLGSVIYPIKMLRYIRREKPDLIHYHNIYGGGKYFYFRFYNVVTLFAKFKGIPIYGWFHVGSLEPIPKIKSLCERYPLVKRLDNFLRTWVFNNSKGITSINHPELERLFNKLHPEYYGFQLKTKYKLVTPNTFNKKVFYPIPKSEAKRILKLDNTKKYMLMVSRLFESKGLHDILEVIPEIIKMKPEFHLLIIGDYIERALGYKKYIEEILAKNEINQYVSFLGRIEHHQGLNLYYNAVEAHILPTYKESFGAVNLESLATRTPVITTNIEEMPYYIKPGLGILIEPGDQVALRKAMLNILEDNFRWNEEEYEKLINIYEYEKAAEDLFEWYKETLA